MDMRKYASGVIMPEDLRNGPRQERIINVYISQKHDVPVLVFESGDELFAWPNIARVLGRAYGFKDEKDWVGHVVKLSLGTYTDKKTGEEKDTIILEAVSSRDGSDNGEPQRVDPAKLPKLSDDLSDEMPF